MLITNLSIHVDAIVDAVAINAEAVQSVTLVASSAPEK